MRFFLISKQISKPKGDLFSHCNPPNMSGLCAPGAGRGKLLLLSLSLPCAEHGVREFVVACGRLAERG